MKICLVNGSLRGDKASSLSFLNDVKDVLADSGYETCMVKVKYKVDGSYPKEELDALSGADAVVLAFPLYGYSIPGALMKLFEDWYRYVFSHNQPIKRVKIYAIVNCAFFDPAITKESIRVLKNFCRRLGLDWRFAIRIGGGPVVVMTKKIPIINYRYVKACRLMADDMGRNDAETVKDILIKPVIPKFIMLKMKDSKWAKKYLEKRSPGMGRYE